LFSKVFITIIFFASFFLHAQSSEKQSIIDRFFEINNFSFNFEQITQEKIETGDCLLKFDNKLKCNYNNKLQKEIIINNKTLVVLQKRYNKIYYYPVSKSPFVNILNKKNLINLIKKSDIKLKNNIELVYIDENKNKITVFFDKKNYELTGWLIKDNFQNEINFSLQIKKINSEIDKNYFKIPVLN
jgi:outer membrane lipoprotein-sorting protein